MSFKFKVGTLASALLLATTATNFASTRPVHRKGGRPTTVAIAAGVARMRSAAPRQSWLCRRRSFAIRSDLRVGLCAYGAYGWCVGGAGK